MPNQRIVDFQAPVLSVSASMVYGGAKSHIELWHEFMTQRKLVYPVKFEALELFASYLIQAEYVSCNCYLSSIVGFVATLGLWAQDTTFERRYQALRRHVGRALRGKLPHQANVVGRGELPLCLSVPMLRMYLFFCLLGIRCHSILGIRREDVSLVRNETGKLVRVDVVVRIDKVPAARGRTVSVHCECAAGNCPLHLNGEEFKQECFPVTRKQVDDLNAQVEASDHTYRVSWTIAVRLVVGEKLLPLYLPYLKQQCGWSKKSQEFHKYSKRYEYFKREDMICPSAFVLACASKIAGQ